MSPQELIDNDISVYGNTAPDFFSYFMVNQNEMIADGFYPN